METVKYAESGPYSTLSSLIGWIDYGEGFTLYNGQSASVVNSIGNGYQISFDVSCTFNPNDSTLTIESFIPPVFGMTNIPFGGIAYKNINGYVVLYMPNATADEFTTTTELIISNISVTKDNKPFNDYVIIAADAETTNYSNRTLETWQATTNGEEWGLLEIMPSENAAGQPPDIEGLGTNTVLETGKFEGMTLVKSPVYLTTGPSELKFQFTTEKSREGVALGIILNVTQTTNCIRLVPGCCSNKCKCCRYRCDNYCSYYNSYIE